MASNDVEICNIALSRIGESRPINSLDDDNTAAQQCKLFYLPMIEQTLRDFPWRFAQKYVDLALIQERPNPEWLYEYRYPSDCIIANKIPASNNAVLAATSHSAAQYRDYYSDGRFGEVLHSGVTYTIAMDANGRVIWTNQEDASLLYTSRVTEAGHFDGSFVNALAWRLAMELAMPIGRDASFKNNASAEYRAALHAARGQSLNEVRDDVKPSAQYINVR